MGTAGEGCLRRRGKPAPESQCTVTGAASMIGTVERVVAALAPGPLR
jgi:hypothetical protein